MNKQTMQLLMIGLAGAAAYLGWRFWQEKKAREAAESVLANEELADHTTGQDTTVPTVPTETMKKEKETLEGFLKERWPYTTVTPSGAGRLAKSGGVRIWAR